MTGHGSRSAGYGYGSVNRQQSQGRKYSRRTSAVQVRPSSPSRPGGTGGQQNGPGSRRNQPLSSWQDVTAKRVSGMARKRTMHQHPWRPELASNRLHAKRKEDPPSTVSLKDSFSTWKSLPTERSPRSST